MCAPRRVLSFGKLRPAKAALSPAAIALRSPEPDIESCTDLFDEFLLTRPGAIPALEGWLRRQVHADHRQRRRSPAYYLVNARLEVACVSRALRSVLGIRAHHFMGGRWTAYLEPADAVRVQLAWDRAARTQQGFTMPGLAWRTAIEVLPGTLRVRPLHQDEFYGWIAEVILDASARHGHLSGSPFEASADEARDAGKGQH